MKREHIQIPLHLRPSPPTRGRGLKLTAQNPEQVDSYVAPHAGAWIETRYPSDHHTPPHVAPHAGAWIETGASGGVRLFG